MSAIENDSAGSDQAAQGIAPDAAASAAGAAEDAPVGAGGFHPFRPVLDDDFENKETNLARPLTDAIVTVRIIKSFAYRSMKALVLKSVDLTAMTVDDLERKCKEEIKSTPAFKVFRTYVDQLGEFECGVWISGSESVRDK